MAEVSVSLVLSSDIVSAAALLRAYSFFCTFFFVELKPTSPHGGILNEVCGREDFTAKHSFIITKRYSRRFDCEGCKFLFHRLSAVSCCKA